MNEVSMAYRDLDRAMAALEEAEEKVRPLRREYERAQERVRRVIAEDAARRRADADFITHAPADVQRLLAENEELNTELAQQIGLKMAANEQGARLLAENERLREASDEAMAEVERLTAILDYRDSNND